MNGTITGNIIGTLYFFCYIAAGIFITDTVLRKESMVTRVWMGSVAGILLLQWLPVPFSFIFGFNIISHLCAVALLVVVTILVYLIAKKKSTYKAKYQLSHRDYLMFAVVFPFTVIAGYLLYTHTILPKDGAMWAGQCTYGDMNMHLGFITSIAKQGFFPPEYSILPGTKLSYPFLSDSVSSSIYIWGSSLRLAYNLPMLIAFINVFTGFWMIMDAWIKRNKMIVLFAFLLFFLNGGFGIIYFLDNMGNNPTNFTRIFTEFYQTPTNYVSDGNVMWVNVIADMMLPQRATLFGWNALFAALFLLIKAQFHDKKNYFIGAALIAGSLPIIHTHSFLALGLVCIAWFLFGFSIAENKKEHFKNWLIFGGIVAVLALWQLFVWTFSQSGDFLKLSPGWDNGMRSNINDIIPLPFIDKIKDFYLRTALKGLNQLIAPWFWIKNIGIVLILLIPAMFSLKKKDWVFYSGALVIYIISLIVIFQPNPYDNNKLLYIWYLLSCVIVANYCAEIYKKIKSVGGIKVIAVIILILGTISGSLTIYREAVSKYELYSRGQVRAAEFINDSTPADSVILTANNHNNAVASLTGRNIVAGSGSFLYFHGFECNSIYEDMKDMYTDIDRFEYLKNKYKVDYVFIGDYESGFVQDRNKVIISDYYKTKYPLIYDSDNIQIYAISEKAIKETKKQ